VLSVAYYCRCCSFCRPSPVHGYTRNVKSLRLKNHPKCYHTPVLIVRHSARCHSVLYSGVHIVCASCHALLYIGLLGYKAVKKLSVLYSSFVSYFYFYFKSTPYGPINEFSICTYYMFFTIWVITRQLHLSKKPSHHTFHIFYIL